MTFEERMPRLKRCHEAIMAMMRSLELTARENQERDERLGLNHARDWPVRPRR
jgi:hypothetical protein